MMDTQESVPAAQARTRREWKEPQWLMPLIDALLVVLAFVLAYVARYDLQILRPVDEPNRAPFHPYIPYVVIFILWLYLNYRGSGLYRSIRGRTWLDEVSAIVNGVTSATIVMLA
ncbi:MAG: hypothetical protein ABI700_06005, partial [Chloroflexota bacterium]